MLWGSGRVVAVDGERYAVKLLSTGKEISCGSGELVPLQDNSLGEDEAGGDNIAVIVNYVLLNFDALKKKERNF